MGKHLEDNNARFRRCVIRYCPHKLHNCTQHTLTVLATFHNLPVLVLNMRGTSSSFLLHLGKVPKAPP